MNITRVLNVALPEMPARNLSDKPPRMPPDAVFREHLEDGQRVVRVLVPSEEAMYRFPPQNWALVQLFDGQTSYEKIAELYSQQRGTAYDVEEVREFAAEMESIGFWYKTTQEKNVQLMQKSAEERRKLLKSRKSKFGDLSEIAFPAINPDTFVTWLYRHTSFIYTWWFTVVSLAAFTAMAGISISHWSEIGHDTAQFFNFTEKSWGDVGVFYVLALSTMCIHELAHAHACKHFGGRVRSMGFMLVYLTPAFFTDTSEGFVKASRFQRLTIAMAGAWAELIICAIATPVWWATPPGTMHELAYLLMLMTGIASLMINWNPLMKLDGYYMLCEIIDIGDLKEASTAYVSAWVKRKIWGLPVDIPYVPRKRRLGFAVYALLSGLYSYTVLYILARFVGNVFRNFNPEWSFIPEIATAALIFRTRIRTLVNFMKFVYLDKKDRVRAWFQTPQAMAVGATILAGLLLPVWHESTTARFVLEPSGLAVIRNHEAGIVAEVNVAEGMRVQAGTNLMKLRSLSLESRVAATRAGYETASKRAVAASLNYINLGTAVEERNLLSERAQELQSQTDSLTITAPISGTVLTPVWKDRLGAYVPTGAEIGEIGDLSEMRGRVYISEHDLYKIEVGAPARALVEGIARKWWTRAASITPSSSRLEGGMEDPNKYKGLSPPQFYVVDILIPNSDGVLKPGMDGTATLYGKRRTLLGLMWREAERFFARKAW